jgi:hypothetical protein
VDALPAIVLFAAVIVALVVGLLRLASKTADASFAEKIRLELSDPELPPLELRRIAYLSRLTAPELHDEIATHPQIYPGLLEWIWSFKELGRAGRATLEAVHDFPEPPLPSE